MIFENITKFWYDANGPSQTTSLAYVSLHYLAYFSLHYVRCFYARNGFISAWLANVWQILKHTSIAVNWNLAHQRATYMQPQLAPDLVCKFWLTYVTSITVFNYSIILHFHTAIINVTEKYCFVGRWLDIAASNLKQCASSRVAQYKITNSSKIFSKTSKFEI